MYTKIDWLSIVLPIGQGEPLPSHHMFDAMLEACNTLSPIVRKCLFSGHHFEPKKGRAPYNRSFARDDSGCYLFCNPVLPHFLIELTGKGCDALSTDADAFKFLGSVQPNLSRIDVASDMLCDTDPITFAHERNAKRFKTHSEFVSSSGKTAYIGSRESNRYARVYRYNPPHERAHLLRAEHVMRHEDARSTAYSILQDGLPAVTVALGAAFGWTNASWTPESVTAAELAVWRPERHSGKTLFWLNSAVAPALVKLCRETGLDATQWLQDNVLSKLSDVEGE